MARWFRGWKRPQAGDAEISRTTIGTRPLAREGPVASASTANPALGEAAEPGDRGSPAGGGDGLHLLVSHYNHLLAEGVPLREAVFRGSMERLNPVLMTALSAGLALIPLALAGGEPGNEIQSPMAIVVLGGLLPAVALNMLVVPALFLRYGAERRPPAAEAAPAAVREPALEGVG